jgi:hypothetical protein
MSEIRCGSSNQVFSVMLSREFDVTCSIEGSSSSLLKRVLFTLDFGSSPDVLSGVHCLKQEQTNNVSRGSRQGSQSTTEVPRCRGHPPVVEYVLKEEVSYIKSWPY